MRRIILTLALICLVAVPSAPAAGAPLEERSEQKCSHADGGCAHNDGARTHDHETIAAAVPTDALRIARPAQTVSYFSKPEGVVLSFLDQPVFCPVLMCHGTCSHREGPCTLRTFDHLLKTSASGCCADAGSGDSHSAAQCSSSHDQCGSSQCGE